MKPAGGYYLLYLTRTDRLTRDRPTGYLFNHFYFLSCVCVCRASLCLARSSREAEKVTTRTNKTKRNARFLFLFLSLFSLSTFLFRVSEEENHENKKQKKIRKMFFFFCFFLCMFSRSVRQLVAVGAVIKYTHAQAREKHTKTDSLIMLSAARERVLPYIHTRQQTCWVFFFLSLLSLFFLRFFLCVVFRFR